MAPVAQDDIDIDTRASDLVESQDSPLRRQFSEPAHPLSNSIRASPSPAPSTRKAKCAWCGKLFEKSDEDGVSHDEALKEHIATVHPHIAKFSMYDGANDEEDDGEENGEEQEDEEEHDQEQDDQDDQEEEEEEVDEIPLDESELALSSQLHEFSRQQETASVQKRLEKFWNIHQASNFSKDYEDEVADLEYTWDYAFRGPKRAKKRDASEFPDRPEPYKKAAVSKGEFLQITPIENFLEQLRDPESKPFDELYAITANVAHALKVWQDEYIAIDNLSKVASRYMLKKTADPRKTEDPELFEDKKEAMLYGYKYSTKPPVGYQDPFVQGGFRPTAAQFRKMTAQVGPNHPNPDGWKPIMKFGIEHVPRFQNPPASAFEGKNTRKRKAAQMEAASSANENDATPTETPAPAETENEADSHPSKRQTRARAGKQPTSRETAQTRTAPPSPAPSRGGASSGRGGRRPRSQVPSATPQPAATTAARSSARAPARSSPLSNVTTPAPLQARSISATAAAPVSGTPIAPNGTTTTAAATATTTTAAPASVVGAPIDPNLDPVELARRQKIANSKNPKRTEAMLNHWAKFNREGRIRNPKRTKAQIEADKAAEALRKAQEPPKPNARKRKNAGANANGASSDSKKKTDIAVSAPQAVQPMPPPGSVPPAGSLPPASSIAPAGSIPPPIQPYAPIDPRAVAPHPYIHGPPPPLAPSQPGPLHQPHQPHPMAYAPPPPGYPTEYYIHYGGPTLPPPAHPRAEAHTRPA